MKYLKQITKHSHQRGTTLIELSVVIAVLLLLVGVLFIGITAWKNGANTAACIVNLSSIQKAVRGYQNMNGIPNNTAIAVTALATAGFWTTSPVCPTGTSYVFSATIPNQGTAYATCTITNHAPSAANVANW